MSTPTVTPPVPPEKAPTADDLLAVTAPQAATELTYTFPDGTVVKGKTQDELLAAAAQRYDAVNQHAQQVKAENAQLRAQVPAPQAAPAAAPGAFDQNVYWDLMAKNPAEATVYALAKQFGYANTEAFVNTMNNTVKAGETFTEMNIASQFVAKNQDFPLANPNALEILTDRMVRMGVDTPSADNMAAAHLLCIKEGLYKPAEAVAAPSAPAQTPQAPPMLTQPAAMASGPANTDDMVNRMTAAQIREAIEKMQGQ